MLAAAIVTAIAERLTRELAPPHGHYRPLRIGRHDAGWVNDARVARLAAFRDIFEVGVDAIRLRAGLEDPTAATAALDGVTRTLAAEGLLTAWRNERYAVAPAFGAPPCFLLERAAARYFGIHTYAAHVNGLVRRDDDVAMWIARRSPTKAIDPGLLDNLVGGGIGAGHDVASTVVKEAWEEAGIAEGIAREALAVGTVDIHREQPDGLQRETIFVHDLWLPESLAPAGQDGEVVAHRLVTLPEAAQLIACADGPDVVTADASLVILDCLLRHGTIQADCPERATLETLRHPRA